MLVLIYYKKLYNKDGKINGDELATVLRAVGQSPTQAQMKEIYKELGISNTSGAGSIDFNGFLSVAKKRVKNSSPQQLQAETDEQIREAFKVFDKNGTGSIDVAELKHVLINLGEKLLPQEVEFYS